MQAKFVLGAEDPLHLRQGVAEHSLGLAILALVPERHTQVHLGNKRGFMVSTNKALARCQRLKEDICRLGVAALRH